MYPTDMEQREREALVTATQGICEDVFGPDGCEAFVFESVAADIYLPSSDIDLVVKVDVGNVDEDYGNCAKRESTTLDPLQQIHNALLVDIRVHGETHQMVKLDVGGVDGDYGDCAERKSKTLDPLRQIHNALLVVIAGPKAA